MEEKEVEVKIIYSTYTPAVKECIKRYREKNKEKINQQTLDNYHKKMQDPAHKEKLRLQAKARYQKKKEEKEKKEEENNEK
jgi:hypothetical protein